MSAQPCRKNDGSDEDDLIAYLQRALAAAKTEGSLITVRLIEMALLNEAEQEGKQ